jgi:hypothetical protein
MHARPQRPHLSDHARFLLCVLIATALLLGFLLSLHA